MSLTLYPAIDLKDGRCVRVVHGDLETATVFNDDPADQAARFQAAGFSWLHVVDLDGAVEGEPRNADCVSDIVSRANIPVQLGGGIRTLRQVNRWLESGVSRVILGTAAVNDPELVLEAAETWPQQVAVAVDVRGGRVAVSGWLEITDVEPVELARRFEDAGVAALLITDIDRDGALQGFNVELFGRVADAVSIPVIAAGGLASVEDVRRIRAWPGAPIHGAVLGRALYSGGITAEEALAAAG